MCVGVECIVTRGFWASQAVTPGVLVGGVVVDDQVQRHARVGLGDLLLNDDLRDDPRWGERRCR